MVAGVAAAGAMVTVGTVATPMSSADGAPSAVTAPAGTFSAVNLRAFTVYGDHVFFTSFDDSVDPDGTLHRADLDGSNVTTVSTVGVDATLSPDGATLWLAAEHSLAAFDLATETTTPYPPPTPLSARPSRMVATSSYVWFLNDNDEFSLGVFDLSDNSYHVMSALGLPTSLHPDPLDPQSVLLSDGLSLTQATITRATLTDSWTLSQTDITTLKGLSPDSLAWSSDGTRFFTADGRVIRSSDLGVVRTNDAAGSLVVGDGHGTLAYLSYSKASLLKESSSTSYKTAGWSGALNRPEAGLFAGSTLWVLGTDDGRTGYTLKAIDVRPEAPLTMKVPQGVYGYRAPVTITVALGAASTNRDVTFTVSEVGRPDDTTTLTIPPTGKLTVTRRLTHNATFTASSSGDSETSAVSRTASVKVKAAVSLEALNSARRAGGYSLFKISAAAKFRGTVRPAHPGLCIVYPTQALNHGHWVPVTDEVCVKMDGAGHSQIRLRGKSGILGVPLRTRAQWSTAEGNKASNSRWLLWKFVR